MYILIQLIIFFFVLFDPLASLGVFFAGTQKMTNPERKKTAVYAIVAAGALCFGTLLLGTELLTLFNTNIDDFRVAGGIILMILGGKMALGYPIHELKKGATSSHAIASLIATPLLTGPAVMTSTILLKNDYGVPLTGAAIVIVLLITLLIFLNTTKIYKRFGRAASLLTTFLGLIIIAWGVNFLRTALGF